MAEEFIGDKIRRLREARGLSQIALRRLTGLSQSTIYRAEAGGIVTAATASRLDAALSSDLGGLKPSHGGRP
jgi:transcriptional regulator with XRE-family HTH domain